MPHPAAHVTERCDRDGSAGERPARQARTLYNVACEAGQIVAAFGAQVPRGEESPGSKERDAG